MYICMYVYTYIYVYIYIYISMRSNDQAGQGIVPPLPIFHKILINMSSNLYEYGPLHYR